MFFLAQPKASNFELKSPSNMTLSERLLMVSKSLRFGFPFGQEMVAKIRFWVLERSISITKASLSVMILKSVLPYSLLMRCLLLSIFLERKSNPECLQW